MSISSIPERTRSPVKSRDSPTRPSSRTSIRSGRGSPSTALSFDDPISIRNQVSTLKHSIRHQTAQLHNLENMLQSQPRIPSLSLGDDHSPTSPVTPKLNKRSSYDVLQGIAGPDSSLPLPRRLDDNSIQEGVPTTSSNNRRTSSPTRTLSRIPVSSVGNARALTDDGIAVPPRSPNTASSSKPLLDGDAQSSSTSHLPPPSPSRRISMTPGGTTKVLADLQTGVINARNALENTKAQLRLSQRSVAQLTRQVEDLREGRERLRLENEGLNNVVARKERLLQEVLERARKAEAEVTTLKAQLKTETTTNKKAVREMETALAESTALSSKSEREYITLRDSIKSMTESWKTDTDRLREEIKRREEKWKVEEQSMGKKYRLLVEEVQAAETARLQSVDLREENTRIGKELEEAWAEEISAMRTAMEKSNKDSEEANATAKELAAELARLRRLMRTAGRAESEATPS